MTTLQLNGRTNRRGYNFVTHGLTKTKEYELWGSIKARCFCKTHKAYDRYGGRGILMSDEFKDDFTSFYNYLQLLPKYNEWLNKIGEKLSLDRIDNDKGYQRGNLRFATQSVQSLNSRIKKSKTSKYRGVSLKAKDKLWVAAVVVDGKYRYISAHRTELEAAKSFNDYVIANKINTRINPIP